MPGKPRESAKHLELGVFAPTIGCMPPAANRSFMLISAAEQHTDITFAYNRRVAEILEQAGWEIFFMAQRMGAGFGPSRFWTTSLDSFTTAATRTDGSKTTAPVMNEKRKHETPK